MANVLQNTDGLTKLTERYEIIRTVDVVVGGESYRLEVYRDYQRDDLPFAVNCWSLLATSQPSNPRHAWFRSFILPRQNYPHADIALSANLQELNSIHVARDKSEQRKSRKLTSVSKSL